MEFLKAIIIKHYMFKYMLKKNSLIIFINKRINEAFLTQKF